MKYFHAFCFNFILLIAASSIHAGIIINVGPTDLTYVSTSTTLTTPGTVVRGNSDQIEVRSRTTAQIPTDNRTVTTFANFDISAIPSGSTIMSATLTATYDSQLNNVNASAPASVGAVTQAWDTSGTNNPLFEYGFDYNSSGNGAINTQVLVQDIENTPATGQAVSIGAAPDNVGVDFTSTVQGWLDGTLDNNGLAFFLDGPGAQGAGFNNVNLQIEYLIPEPSSVFLLTILGSLGLLIRRRRIS